MISSGASFTARGNTTRSADVILREQSDNIESTRPILDLLQDLTCLTVGRLLDGDIDVLGSAVRVFHTPPSRLFKRARE